MKVYVDPLIAETVPDGTFGGARPRRWERKPRPVPDPSGRKHLAELAQEVAAFDAANRARRRASPA
ncbi:hypothetical protein GTY54_28735 [Streptomyces sp. SID625]|nr:hypothetical protein [Streptomyces sp. SID625]